MSVRVRNLQSEKRFQNEEYSFYQSIQGENRSEDIWENPEIGQDEGGLRPVIISTGDDFAPWRIFVSAWRHFFLVTTGNPCFNLVRREQLVLNILQCLEQFLLQRNIVPKMSVMLLLGNPGLGDYEKAPRMGNLYRMSKIRRLMRKGTHALYFL